MLKQLEKIELEIYDKCGGLYYEQLEPVYCKLYNVVDKQETSRELLDLYFASKHQQLNNLLIFMNSRINGSKYYTANESRNLISLIKELDIFEKNAKMTKYEFVLVKEYKDRLTEYKDFLSPGGTKIPEDAKPTDIIKYEKIFLMQDVIDVPFKETRVTNLKYLGEGSFASVHSFIDPMLNIKFAKKKLLKKKEIKDKDILRFKREYEKMHSLNSPYLVKAFTYDELDQSYIMEYCENSLKDFIKKRNSTLKFSVRKNLAMQFLNALKYIYSKGILHRDLSYNNILIKEYDDVFVVKLSDFGLMKDVNDKITDTDSSLKGTFLDPCLSDFKQYEFINEEYSIGFMLVYIFCGRTNMDKIPSYLKKIALNCTSNELDKRYKTIDEIINVVKDLKMD